MLKSRYPQTITEAYFWGAHSRKWLRCESDLPETVALARKYRLCLAFVYKAKGEQ